MGEPNWCYELSDQIKLRDYSETIFEEREIIANRKKELRLEREKEKQLKMNHINETQIIGLEGIQGLNISNNNFPNEIRSQNDGKLEIFYLFTKIISSSTKYFIRNTTK